MLLGNIWRFKSRRLDLISMGGNYCIKIDMVRNHNLPTGLLRDSLGNMEILKF